MSLPSGYTQLEWIQSTGTQYIDTGVSATNSIGFEIDFETTSPISTTDFGTILGCINSGTNRYNLGTYPDKSGGQLTFGSNVYNPYLSTSTRLLLSLRGTKLTTPNGVQTVSGSFSVGATITVFARNRTNGVIDEYSKTKLYYLKLYNGTTVVRDFVPAKRKSDGVIGLYDLQNGAFYTNSGTGTFTAGPEANYTKLSYIECPGGPYINTRFVPDQDTRTVMTGKLLENYENGSLFGARTSSASNLYTMTWLYASNQFLSNYGTGYVYVPFEINAEFSLDKNKNTTTMNGTVYSDAYESFTCPGPMYLFATNANGSLLHYGVFRLYSCQIYDNNTLVRDFIPARRNSDGAVGLLDQANNVFYANAGTGTFTAGPEISSTGSLANVDNTSALLTGCLANVGGVEYAIPYALANVDGIEVVIPFDMGPDYSDVLDENTPEMIAQAAIDGVAPDLWDVGDTVGIALNGTVGALTFSNETYYAFILGFDHNPTIEGYGTIHFQMAKTAAGVDIAFCDSNYGSTGSSAGFRMNTSNSNSGGWNGSYMRKTICPAFLSAMPSAWQSVIAACTKYSDNTGGGSNTASYVTTTSDKIWLLSEFEVQGARSYANSAEQNYQKQYDYYKNGNSKVKYKHNATTTACFWWLRSVRASNNSAFCYVLTGGGATGGIAYYSLGFAPGFVVGNAA